MKQAVGGIFVLVGALMFHIASADKKGEFGGSLSSTVSKLWDDFVNAAHGKLS